MALSIGSISSFHLQKYMCHSGVAGLVSATAASSLKSETTAALMVQSELLVPGIPPPVQKHSDLQLVSCSEEDLM